MQRLLPNEIEQFGVFGRQVTRDEMFFEYLMATSLFLL